MAAPLTRGGANEKRLWLRPPQGLIGMAKTEQWDVWRSEKPDLRASPCSGIMASRPWESIIVGEGRRLLELSCALSWCRRRRAPVVTSGTGPINHSLYVGAIGGVLT